MLLESEKRNDALFRDLNVALRLIGASLYWPRRLAVPISIRGIVGRAIPIPEADIQIAFSLADFLAEFKRNTRE